MFVCGLAVAHAERGRGIFENVLRNYPKRLDLWSVYLDQEIKLGDLQRCRSLFERVTYLQLPPKKMKVSPAAAPPPPPPLSPTCITRTIRGCLGRHVLMRVRVPPTMPLSLPQAPIA